MSHANTDSPVRLCIGILTLTEENRLASGIRRAALADQSLVIDSGSRDATVAMAQSLGAETHHYPDWKGFAEQRNRLLQHCRGEYVFFLDADEEITPQLQQEIEHIVLSGEDAVWEVQWNQVAFGKPLTRMRSTGGVQRLFKARSISHFEGVVHEKAITTPERPVRHLRARLTHYSRETIYGSLQKLAQYAQLGAAKRAKAGKSGGVLRGMASAYANFFRLYVLGRGFMCGAEGFLYCFFVALESFFRYAMLRYDQQSLTGFAKR